MYTITYAIQKGGTGKTSLSVSTAVELSNAGKKVLLIDADPQGNASTWIYGTSIKNELADILLDKCDIKNAIQKTKLSNLSIIATNGTSGALKEYADNNARLAKLKNLLRQVQKDYDYCIIDTSPSFGNFEKSIYYATNEIIVVLQLDNFSKDGANIFLKRLNQYYNDDLDADAPRPKFNKIILNAKHEGIKLQNEYFEQFKGLLGYGYELYTVPQDQAFKTAQAMYLPVQSVTKKKETLQSIKDIAIDLMKE